MVKIYITLSLAPPPGRPGQVQDLQDHLQDVQDHLLDLFSGWFLNGFKDQNDLVLACFSSLGHGFARHLVEMKPADALHLPI